MSTNSLCLTLLVCDSACHIIIIVINYYYYYFPQYLFFFFPLLSALFKGAGPGFQHPGDGLPGAETTLDSAECRWGGCEKEVWGALSVCV